MRASTTAAVILCGACWAGAASGQGSDAAMLQGIVGALEKENAECEVGVSFLGRVSTNGAARASQFDHALVVVYTVESCNRGNNWLSSAQVYGVKEGRARPLGTAHVWSVVKGVDFADHRALVYAVDQAPGDGHCCPTDGKTVEITVREDRPIFRTIRSWVNKNP